MKKVIIPLLGFLCLQLHAQKFDDLALTPPMGWNSWNNFACNVDEGLIRETADAMVESGMKDAGYTYVNIDDCWHGERDSLGFIQPSEEHFPSGMKALADYIHSKGLKFGIYSDAGWTTCAGEPGSRGREYQDAMTYASWGVDYLKYDWCATEGLKAEGAYLTMREALYEAGRPIVFSICEWGDNEPWKWAMDIGHSWRISGDIYNCFACEYDHGSWSSWGVLNIIDMRDNDSLRKVAGPGRWNDYDMMEVGNGMKVNHDRVHFSMWCMLASPLIAGNDIRDMSQETIDILTNREAIAVNQDSLGIQAFKYDARNDVGIWFKPLQHGDWAVCFLNRDNNDQSITFDWKSEEVIDHIFDKRPDFKNTTYGIRDIWNKKVLGTTEAALNAEVPGQDVLMLRLTKK